MACDWDGVPRKSRKRGMTGATRSLSSLLMRASMPKAAKGSVRLPFDYIFFALPSGNGGFFVLPPSQASSRACAGQFES